MTDDKLRLVRGTFDILILKTVSWGPTHGYAVLRWIQESSQGELCVEEGALYPALRRLEARGLLTSSWRESETKREARFYQITPEGKRALRRELGTWERYVRSFSRVLTARPAGSIA